MGTRIYYEDIIGIEKIDTMSLYLQNCAAYRNIAHTS